jgi:DNA-binding transcriptional LysR family regulator
MLNDLFKAERPRRNIVCVVSSFEAMLRTLQTGPYLGVVPLAFELPAYRVSAWWHNVGHHDPALQWLRGQLQQVCLELA